MGPVPQKEGRESGPMRPEITTASEEAEAHERGAHELFGNEGSEDSSSSSSESSSSDEAADDVLETLSAALPPDGRDPETGGERKSLVPLVQ